MEEEVVYLDELLHSLELDGIDTDKLNIIESN